MKTTTDHYDSDNKFSHYGHTYLVVEDNIHLCSSISQYFENLGAAVDVACNGLEGFNMFQASPHKYSLIIMDMQMPVMDGYESSNCIRCSQLHGAESIPIIAMSGNSVGSDKFNKVLYKPFMLQDLDNAIKKLICNRQNNCDSSN